VSPAVDGEQGGRSASLELGVMRLALPLALVADGSVLKATRAWDEETGLLPGARVAPAGRLTECIAAADAAGGGIAVVGGWTARTVGSRTWIAVPPDSAVDRARDVLDGMVHERALWDNVPEPGRSRIVALAAILSSLIGGTVERVPGETWNRRAAEVARVYGLAMRVPRFAGAGAVDPRVALFLAAEFGERLDAEDDELYLRIAPRWRDHPLVRVFVPDGEGSLKLS
jgi:hypothetical protein